MPSSQISKDAMTETAKCLHIYQDMGADICPLCAQCTHEIDWVREARLHREWIEEGKADWSICPVEGGTLRGWWSI